MAEDDISIDGDAPLRGVVSILSPDELMTVGLCVFYKNQRIFRSRRSTNIARFRKKYGLEPYVAVLVWEDLQTKKDYEARNPKEKLSPRYFLMALHTLRKYPTEKDREAAWDVSAKTGREWVWYYLRKIQALKHQKIVWPPATFWGSDIWIVTVDGTHCWINEPIHPDW